MRFAVTVVLWLATTVALAVAIPAAWTQFNVIDTDGYAAMAEQAAADPGVQSAVASELSTRATALIAAQGGGRNPVDSSKVYAAASAFTAGPSFPPLFAQLNRAAHAWLFTDPRSGPDGDRWVLDVAPMLKDNAFAQVLSSHNVEVPATLTVPLTVTVPFGPSGSRAVRQGQLHRLATWGPWLSIGAAALTGFCALLTLVAARGRGKALTGLGVSALLVGAAGWAGIEVGGRYLNNALNTTTGDVRRIAEVMIGHAEAGLHHWLNLTLAAGAALAVFGVVVAVLGGLRRPQQPG